MNILKQHDSEINNLCKRFNVKSLYAFGSVLSDRFSEKSDIDLIVDFEDISLEKYADNYFDLKFSLEDVLHRSIDLLEAKAIKNPYLIESINGNKQLIWSLN